MTNCVKNRQTVPGLFTVIVISYNNCEYLPVSVASVCSQDYPAIELVIADDGSRGYTSETEDMIRETVLDYPNISRLVFTSEGRNVGTVKNINRAIERSSGEYFKILAADDALYDSRVLSNAADAFHKQKAQILVARVMKCAASDLAEVEPYRSGLQEELGTLSPKDCYLRLCVKNEIVAGGVFLSGKIFDDVCLFDERFRLLEDWPMWLTLSKRGIEMSPANFFALKYRMDAGVGRSVNPLLLADRKRVHRLFVKGEIRNLGVIVYLKAFVSHSVRSSEMIRRMYGYLFRSDNGVGR